MAALTSMALAHRLYLTDSVFACTNYKESCAHRTQLAYHFSSVLQWLRPRLEGRWKGEGGKKETERDRGMALSTGG